MDNEKVVRVPMKNQTRRRLRVFKARSGTTYDEAINKLLNELDDHEQHREVPA